MKKLVSILLTLALILSLSISVLADQPETVKLTITGAAGHKYAVYQVFTGDVAFETEGTTTKKVLSNVKYGQSYGVAGDKVTDDTLNALLATANLADFLKGQVQNPVEETDIAGTEPIVITDLTPGYYLVKDVTDPLPDGHTESPVILAVLDNVTIASKHASIVSEKKVDDHNDSNNDENDTVWQDVADYDINDFVPFQLSVTLPSTFENYGEVYGLTFHDKQDQGFNDPTNVQVYLQRVEDGVTNEYEIGRNYYTYSAHEDGCGHADCDFGTDCSFDLSFVNVNHAYESLNKEFVDGDKIIVRYESQLNGYASNGRGGNINSMYVVHPDGHTPVDHVAVLTYQLTVNKVDKDEVALSKAGFTLYKWVVSEENVNGAWEKLGNEIGGKDYEGNEFVWGGLDGGTYKLVESTTPDGYNTMAPLEFVIDADHVTEWHGDASVLRLRYVAAFSPDKAKVEFSDIDNGVEDGLMEGNVINYKGVVLPSTGAEGTFFLITGGTLLVVLAAVFMITRKKMSIYED